MSKYLHGFHAGSITDGYSSTGAQNMEDRPGCIVFTEIASIDGGDYSLYKSWGYGVLVRLNHGYFPNGTIPEKASYPDFAVTCAQHVKNSSGVDGWIIGNEPNHSQERPNGVPIYALDYADCFRMCRDAIKAETPAAQVIVAGIAPYNNETGDFRLYLGAVLQFLDGGYDGVALHAYTHGADPGLITSEATMYPPLSGAHYHFRVYRDFMHYIPDGVPVYIPETDQDIAWADINSGWVRAMYREVDEWNEDNPARVIRCACLYRYPQFDRWGIAGKQGVITDFRQAVDIGYTWTDTDPDPDPEPPEEDNVIVNPSMEQPYIKQGGTVWVAAGWTGWWNTGDPPQEQSQGPLAQPEFKEAPISLDAHRVSEGLSSQCWFIGSKVMDGGVYQTIPTEAGKWYRYAVDAQTWCSDSNDPYTDDGEMYFMIGLDPDGGTSPKSTSIVWMQWDKLIKNFKRVTSQQVKATGPTMTVFLRAWNKWKLRHNDVYVDNGELVSEGDPDPDPDPPDPTPGECNALSEAQTRAIVAEMIPQIRAVVREELDKTRFTSV